jgi:hypothetical protein
MQKKTREYGNDLPCPRAYWQLQQMRATRWLGGGIPMLITYRYARYLQMYMSLLLVLAAFPFIIMHFCFIHLPNTIVSRKRYEFPRVPTHDAGAVEQYSDEIRSFDNAGRLSVVCMGWMTASGTRRK